MSRNSLSQVAAKRGTSWAASLEASWRAILRFDRSQISAFQAIRSTFGFMLPLALGVATGQVTVGIVIASGALSIGSVGLRDPYPTRVRSMLFASFFVTLSTLVGGITGSTVWLLIPATGIWGFIAGMFASVSPVGMVVGLQACTALIVFAHLALNPVQAAQIALLVLAGTLLQIALAVIPSPWRNTAPERSALAHIYQKLADYAANPFSEQGDPQLADVLLQGHTTLMNSNTSTAQGKMFARLLDEAERIRLILIVLASSSRHLTGEQPQAKDAADCLNRIIRASGDELRLIAQAIKSSPRLIERDVPLPPGSYESVKQALAELRRLADIDSNQHIQQILPYGSTLLAELRITRRLAVSWKSAGQSWLALIHFPYPRPPRLHLENAWSSIRANLTLQSGAFRHSLRLGLALVLATALYQFLHLPLERGYWIPMTVVLVLRADFITTFTRGIARIAGTLLGAVLTTLLVVALAPSKPLLIAIIVIAAYLMYSTLFANYAIFSVAITIAVVFLLSFTTPQTLASAANRAIDTAIGGAFALLIYTIWPTWEQNQVPAKIAERFETQGHYVNAIMQCYADPRRRQSGEFNRRHVESRLARSNAIGSVQRALQEPETRRHIAKLAQGLLDAADNISRRILTLEAYLDANPLRDTLPEIAAFGNQVDQAMSQLAVALREGRQAMAMPDLQEAFHTLQAATRAKKGANDEAREQWRFLIVEAKGIEANIQAIQQLLLNASFRKQL